MPHKLYVAALNGVQKNRPKDKYYFLNKLFENITDNKTDLTAEINLGFCPPTPGF